MKSLTKYVIILSVASVISEAAVISNPQPQLRSFAETKDLTPFIIDGIPAKDGDFPWQVALIGRVNEKNGFCGGSLISDQHILTAAHCVPKLNALESISCIFKNLFSFNIGKICFTTNFEIKIGSADLNSGGIVTTTTDATVHPRYNSKTAQNDVAIIKLREPVTLSSTIKPIELSDEPLATGVTVVVSGWGKTADASEVVSNILNSVSLTTISNAQCNGIYGANLAGDLVVCAVGTQTKNACNGDSGGPLVRNVNGKPLHVGVVSFKSLKGCEAGDPSGYSRTAPHIPWIKKQTGIV